MKKTSLIITILLAIAIAVLYILHFTGIGTGNVASVKKDSDSTDVAAGPVVYIRTDTLLNHYDFFKDLQADLSTKAKIVEDDLNKKGRAFEKDVANFQEKVQKGLITRSQAETQQNQLAARQQELRYEEDTGDDEACDEVLVAQAALPLAPRVSHEQEREAGPEQQDHQLGRPR